MLDSLYNNSNRIGVRINNLNNDASHNDFEGATKIKFNESYWVWKVELAQDLIVDGSISALVTANRNNGSPFGGPLLEGESRVFSYSLNGGKTWTLLSSSNTTIPGTQLTVRAGGDNSTLMNISYPGDAELEGNVEVVFKVEMQYTSPATPHVNYKGPEYFDFILIGNPISRGFIDTNTETLFDGHAPYVHWFPGDGQSVGLNYVMTLWYVSDRPEIEVSLDENAVFKLLDASTFDDPSNFEDLENCTNGVQLLHGVEMLSNGTYVYPIYLCAKADSPGQYTHPINIEGTEYLIGIDAYMENESLYINLANMGVEIPDSVQKALYTNNVHEEKKDNILLNRKFKELISQYWETLAGRGSYKSLLNSLDWFEWGDGVRLREIWSRANELGLSLMNDRELSALLKEEYKNTLTTFKKTTYMSIYHSLEKLLMVDDEFVYDEQKNPVLDYARELWSKEDLSMKLAMLAAFYETFFMPIHLELLHCTIEDIVFTNTFKEVFGAAHSRRDTVYDSCEVLCNIKDGDNFYLHNIRTQTNYNTLFGWDYEREHDAYSFGDHNWDLNGLEQFTADVEEDEVGKELVKRVRGLYKEVEVIGVEDEYSAGDMPEYVAEHMYDENDIDISRAVRTMTVDETDVYMKNFWAQYYHGVGVVVPFEIIMHVSVNDSLKEERLVISKYDDEGKLIKTSVRTSHVAIDAVAGADDYIISVPFKLLFTEDASWQLRIELTTVSGLNTVKILNINTLDLGNAVIRVYRVRPNDPEETYDNDVTDYMMQRQPFLPLADSVEENLPYNVDDAFYKQYTYTQFLPYYRESNKSIQKNRILVFDVHDASSSQINNIKSFLNTNDFAIFERKPVDSGGNVDNTQTNFVIGVSNWFDDGREIVISDDYIPYLYRNDSGFFGQFHHLEPLAEDEATDPITSFFVHPEEVLCVVPDIKFAHDITESEWEFKNVSKNKSYIVKSNDNEHTISAQTPFVAPNKGMLEPGYYDVIFRYKIKSSDDTVRTLRRNSAFKLLKK